MQEKLMVSKAIQIPPKGLAVLSLMGPSLVWCAEYIGSGEVILATRTGAILGTSVIWAIVFGIFLKYWIGMSGARYTVCTGEGTEWLNRKRPLSLKMIRPIHAGLGIPADILI